MNINQKSLFKARPPKKRKKLNFEPDREYCQKSMEEYLQNGGTIEKLSIAGQPVMSDNRGRFGVHEQENDICYIPKYIPDSIDY